jgi:hypothetical protein
LASRATLDDKALTTLEPGQDAYISQVQTHDPDKLRYLGGSRAQAGGGYPSAQPGTFTGPLRVYMRSQEYVLGQKCGHELASMIRVEAQN